MKTHTISIILFLNILILHAQNNFEKINKKICTGLEKIDIKNTSKSKLLEIQAELVNRVVKENSKSISQIKAKIKKEFPEYGTNKIDLKTQADMLFYLLDNCPKYLELTRKTTIAHKYPDKQSLRLITKDFNEFLEKNSDKTYKELNSIIDKKIIPFLKKHYDRIIRDYPEGPASRQFQNDIMSSLMMNSDIYFKSTLHAQYSN